MKKKPLLERMANKVGLFSKRQVKESAQRALSGTNWQLTAINRLTQAWATTSQSIDSEIRQNLGVARARCRNLAQENDYGKAFMRMIRTNVVGEYGIQLKNKAMDPPSRTFPNGLPDKFANRLVENAWYEWNRRGNCTVDRSMSGCDIQKIAIETAGRDGEILARKVRGFDNDASYAIQMLDPEYLDHEKNEDLGNGSQIRMGVEMNKWRQPIAYWLLRRHPADNLYYADYQGSRYERVDASEIIHSYIWCRPEQSRGIPWMATSGFRLNMVGKYEEAEAVASRLAASKVGLLIPDANSEYTGEMQGDAFLMDAEPGSIEQLPKGMGFQAIDWQHPNSSYQVFMKTCLRGVAAGLGVSYNTLANDMEGVSFSSGRLGIEDERKSWKALQNWFIESFINRIFEDWLFVQLQLQNIPLPFAKFSKFNSPDWRAPRWSYINPIDEVKSKVTEVQAGFTSISRVLADRGLDRDEVFQELSEDMEAADELGLDLPALIAPEPAAAGQPANAAPEPPDSTP